MNTITTLRILVLQLAIHSFCGAEGSSERVILVPPEKLGFVIHSEADPFSDKSPIYLPPAKPLRQRLEEQTGIKLPEDSRIFYDTSSRALSISSTKSVTDALAKAYQTAASPNVIVDLQTYESPRPGMAADSNGGRIAQQKTIVSHEQFLAYSGRMGSLRIKVPDSITKSGGLAFQIIPTVSAEGDSVDAEITLAEDVPASVMPSTDTKEKSALLKTRLWLKFNTATSIYERQLPSGECFGVAVRLVFPPGNPDPRQKADEKSSESSESPQR